MLDFKGTKYKVVEINTQFSVKSGPSLESFNGSRPKAMVKKINVPGLFFKIVEKVREGRVPLLRIYNTVQEYRDRKRK